MSAASDEQRYTTLTELIEHQIMLAGEGRFEDLVQAQQAAAALIAALPAQPPASAADTLTRASALHKRLEIELLRGREALLLELAMIDRARRMADGYAPPRRPLRVLETA